jgi:hypothetical protein
VGAAAAENKNALQSAIPVQNLTFIAPGCCALLRGWSINLWRPWLSAQGGYPDIP